MFPQFDFLSCCYFVKCLSMIILCPILLQESLLVNDMKYPHIVHVEQGITKDVNSKVSSAVGTQVIDLEG